MFSLFGDLNDVVADGTGFPYWQFYLNLDLSYMYFRTNVDLKIFEIQALPIT